jgi:hypothetical protein
MFVDGRFGYDGSFPRCRTMSRENAERWKRWFRNHCAQWDDADKRRYVNVVNDPEDVDDIELESARELIEEINGKPPAD